MERTLFGSSSEDELAPDALESGSVRIEGEGTISRIEFLGGFDCTSTLDVEGIGTLVFGQSCEHTKTSDDTATLRVSAGGARLPDDSLVFIDADFDLTFTADDRGTLLSTERLRITDGSLLVISETDSSNQESFTLLP